jgi:rhodanese-related sulfurtransferase
LFFMKMITAGEIVGGDLLLDVRSAGEFGYEHIEGSQCDPLDVLDAGAWAAKLDGSRRCVVVCQAGMRAKRAAERLEAAGAKNVVVLEGGVNGWKAAGKPCLRGERRVLPLDRQVRIVIGLMILAGVGLGATVGSAWYALAAFAGAGMVFAGITDICPLATLVGKMPWNAPGTGAGATCCAGKSESSCCAGGGK